MLIYGLSEAEIREAVRESRLSVFGDYYRDGVRTASGGIYAIGTGLRVRLAVDMGQDRDADGLLPFQRRSRSVGGRPGRRMPYVTWEGHREFMRIVFRDHPEARIKTAIADYRGRDDFWKKHPETKERWGRDTLRFHA